MSGILQQKRTADSINETFRNEHLDKQDPAQYLGPSGTMHIYSGPARQLQPPQQRQQLHGNRAAHLYAG
jgi:hypothetical protein